MLCVYCIYNDVNKLEAILLFSTSDLKKIILYNYDGREIRKLQERLKFLQQSVNFRNLKVGKTGLAVVCCENYNSVLRNKQQVFYSVVVSGIPG